MIENNRRRKKVEKLLPFSMGLFNWKSQSTWPATKTCVHFSIVARKQTLTNPLSSERTVVWPFGPKAKRFVWALEAHMLCV